MRTYGRVYAEDGSYKWVEVGTTPQGFNDYVWITTLVQVFKLNLGESPFYGNYGIPAKPSVVQQVVPDYYMLQTQQQFQGYFASLQISKADIVQAQGQAPVPTYTANLTTNFGVKMALNIPV